MRGFLQALFTALGVIVLAKALAGFVLFSIIAIIGEVRTYRALKR
jgi:uncharacterized membrane protein